MIITGHDGSHAKAAWTVKVRITIAVKRLLHVFYRLSHYYPCKQSAPQVLELRASPFPVGRCPMQHTSPPAKEIAARLLNALAQVDGQDLPGRTELCGRTSGN